MKIDWAYLRKGWTSCKKAQEVLDKNNVEIKNTADARKKTIKKEAGWDLLKNAKHISVAKGKKTKIYAPSEQNREDLLKDALGRTGNLRAPTLRIRDDFYIGFNVNMYEELINLWTSDMRTHAGKDS